MHALQVECDTPTGTISSYGRKKRAAASVPEPEENRFGPELESQQIIRNRILNRLRNQVSAEVIVSTSIKLHEGTVQRGSQRLFSLC